MSALNYYLKGAISKEKLSKIKNNSTREEILNKPLQIFLMVSTHGIRLQIYTKKRIPQKLWNSEKKEARSNKLMIGGIKINKWLSSLRSNMSDLLDENERMLRMTTKREIEEVLSRKILDKPKGKSFEELYTDFLGSRRGETGNPVKKPTVYKYNRTLKLLEKYSKYKKIPLTVNHFNADYFNSFKDYLTDTYTFLKKGEEKHMCDNTANKHLESAVAFLDYCIRKGLIKPFDTEEIIINKGGAGEIFVLPLQSVIDLQYLEIKNERLARVRDLFCFTCWTGQRISDYKKSLIHSNFYDDEKKVGEKVWKFYPVKPPRKLRTVPIFNWAQELLDKYKGNPRPIPILSEPNYNKYLKELAAFAGFDKTVKIVKYYKGEPVEKNVPFHTILTSHVGRKSFITNALVLEMQEYEVKEISGHTDDRSFKRYVNLTELNILNNSRKAFDKEHVIKVLAKNQ